MHHRKKLRLHFNRKGGFMGKAGKFADYLQTFYKFLLLLLSLLAMLYKRHISFPFEGVGGHLACARLLATMFIGKRAYARCPPTSLNVSFEVRTIMNDNPYDTSLEWMGFHNQQTENIRQQEAMQRYPFTPAYQREKIRPAPSPRSSIRRLSKSEALERVSYLKGFIMLATLLGFGTLGGLVANQIFSTTPLLNQTSGGPAVQGPSVQAPSQQNPFPSSQSDSGSGGFFGHHDGGGYGFGQNNNSGSSGSSGSFSGSHTS
jgi:hypothetical protein